MERFHLLTYLTEIYFYSTESSTEDPTHKYDYKKNKTIKPAIINSSPHTNENNNNAKLAVSM